MCTASTSYSLPAAGLCKTAPLVVKGADPAGTHGPRGREGYDWDPRYPFIFTKLKGTMKHSLSPAALRASTTGSCSPFCRDLYLPAPGNLSLPQFTTYLSELCSDNGGKIQFTFSADSKLLTALLTSHAIPTSHPSSALAVPHPNHSSSFSP